VDVTDATGRNRTLVERVLCVFTEVRAGEGPQVLALTANIYLILTAYYIIKPVREALMLSGGGAELKSYLSAGQVLLLLLVVVPAFSRLAGRLPRRRLINSVNVFFIANLIAFYLLAQLRVSSGPIFFLWAGIFNLMVPALFWSFANDIYTLAEGKRLFVIVAFGASFGAISGSWLTSLIIEPLGVYQLLLVSAALLAAALGLTNVVEMRNRGVARRRKGAEERNGDGLGGGGAFRMVIGNRYLLLIAMLLLLLNWVNTTGEYVLGRTVEDRAVAEAAARAEDVPADFDAEAFEARYIGKFYAGFFTGVNILAVLIQLLLVSRILKHLGLRVAVMILPLIAMGGYLLLVFVPSLGLLRWAKTAENATDYSLQNTVRHALFLPTSREQKYKAKQAIDTFFVRAGDVLSALLVYVGTALLALPIKGFALINVALALGWLAVAFAVGREFRAIKRARGTKST
jgi:AAA family ATP:ADP antiporter